MSAENKESQFLKPGYGELLDTNDFFHHVRRGAESHTMGVDTVDHTVIKGVSNNKGKPIATVLHCMIGQSVKCWAERHEFLINELLDQVISLEHILGLYRERYGRLPVVKKDNRE